jgi:hypothetical protein
MEIDVDVDSCAVVGGGELGATSHRTVGGKSSNVSVSQIISESFPMR